MTNHDKLSCSVYIYVRQPDMNYIESDMAFMVCSTASGGNGSLVFGGEAPPPPLGETLSTMMSYQLIQVLGIYFIRTAQL